MKKFFNLLILLIFLPIINFSEAKIGYVDVNYILQNSNEGKKIIYELNIEKKKNDDLIKSKKKDLETQQNNINQIKNITEQDELQKKILELKMNIDKFNKFKEDQVMSYEKIKKDKLDSFFISLNEILISYIEINEIKIIIDNKNIVIADKSLDFTNEILTLVNGN